MPDYGIQADILKGNLLEYKGALFKNKLADALNSKQMAVGIKEQSLNGQFTIL